MLTTASNSRTQHQSPPIMAFRLSVTRLTANPLFATSSYAAITPASFRGKQTISRGIKQMLDEANKTVDTLTTEQAIELHAKNDPNVVFVDLRDPRELEREGKMPGAVGLLTTRVETKLVLRSHNLVSLVSFAGRPF